MAPETFASAWHDIGFHLSASLSLNIPRPAGFPVLGARPRAVHATISFFQALDISIVILEIPIGELLDPVNDAVERLLSVMVWAVGSLALQRIVIEIASSSAFKWAFLGIGLMAIATWLLGTWQRIRDLFGAWDGFSAFLVRLFVYLAVFRFIVPVFAIASFLVGHLLFDAEINKSKEDLSLFSAGISVDDNTPLPGTPEFEEQRVSKVTELDELRERMASYTQEAEALDARIQELKGGGLRQYLPESLGGGSPDERQALTGSGVPELDELLERRASYMEEAEALDARIRELRGGGLRQYLPESLGGLSPDQQRDLTPSGLPELDELRERMASYTEEAEALDARIQELKGGGLRQYLPESLGGGSPDERQALTGSGVPELDELLERMASYTQEAEALDTLIQELRGVGLRQYLPESLGGLSPDEQRDLTPSGLPELDKLLERRASYVEEDEALDARIQELRGVGLRQYLPESLGGLSPDEQRDLTPSGLPELDELLERRASYVEEAEALDARIQELRGGGLRQYLPESLGGVPLGEELATAEARREEVSGEMQTIESRIRAMEGEQRASAEARRQEILREAEARHQEIRREMDAVEERIGAIGEELLSSAKARREEVSAGMETAQSQIQVVEEELECIEKKSAGEDCVSLLGNLSAMAQEGYARIRDLVGRAGEIVATTIKLMIFVIVKNILLPIAFLMIAVKCALPVARYGARLTTDFRRDVRELAATVSPNPSGTRLKERSD